MQTCSTDNMPKEVQLSLEKLALLHVGIQLMFPWQLPRCGHAPSTGTQLR